MSHDKKFIVGKGAEKVQVTIIGPLRGKGLFSEHNSGVVDLRVSVSEDF